MTPALEGIVPCRSARHDGRERFRGVPVVNRGRQLGKHWCGQPSQEVAPCLSIRSPPPRVIQSPPPQVFLSTRKGGEGGEGPDVFYAPSRRDSWSVMGVGRGCCGFVNA